MSSTMSYCVTGCVVRGKHAVGDGSECLGAEVCRGCLPRRAVFGRLCRWCWQRLHADVVDAPGLVEHLRAMAEPDAGATPPSGARASRAPSEGSVLSAAVDAADEVHAVLASWAQEIVDKHPAGLRGPSEVGWWRTRTTTAVDRDTGEVYLRRSQTFGARDTSATADLVRWLLPHLAWVSEQEWAGEMRSELGHLIGTTKARWPMEERSRPVLHATCRECGRASLVYYPPSYPGAQVQVACSHPECGQVYDERAWALLTGDGVPEAERLLVLRQLGEGRAEA